MAEEKKLATEVGMPKSTRNMQILLRRKQH